MIGLKDPGFETGSRAGAFPFLYVRNPVFQLHNPSLASVLVVILSYGLVSFLLLFKLPFSTFPSP